MFSLKNLTIKSYKSRIKWIMKHLIYHTFIKGSSSFLLALSRTKSPFFIGNFGNFRRSIISSKHKTPHLLHKIESLRISYDGFFQSIVHISLWGRSVQSSSVRFSFHSPFCIFGEVHDELVCHTRLHTKKKSTIHREIFPITC